MGEGKKSGSYGLTFLQHRGRECRLYKTSPRWNAKVPRALAPLPDPCPAPLIGASPRSDGSPRAGPTSPAPFRSNKTFDWWKTAISKRTWISPKVPSPDPQIAGSGLSLQEIACDHASCRECNYKRRIRASEALKPSAVVRAARITRQGGLRDETTSKSYLPSWVPPLSKPCACGVEGRESPRLSRYSPPGIGKPGPTSQRYANATCCYIIFTCSYGLTLHHARGGGGWEQPRAHDALDTFDHPSPAIQSPGDGTEDSLNRHTS